jgi:hypothetical protein
VISYFVNEAKDEKLRLIVSNSEPVIAKEEKSTITLISIVENISLNQDLAIQALYYQNCIIFNSKSSNLEVHSVKLKFS